MDFSLSEDLQLLRDTARRFGEEHIAPHAQEWDRASNYPDEILEKLGEAGFMGIMIPEELGGGGGGYMTFAVVLEEIARFDGGLALAVEAHNGLCCGHLLRAANDEQRKRLLPPLASGERIGSWCLSEPSSGSDAAALTTRAAKSNGDWVINGAKQFITNGERAGTYVVLARTAEGKGGQGISAFAVEAGAKGLSTGKREDKLGMRSSDTVCVYFDDVRVPEGNLLGKEGEGFNDVKVVLERGRVMISAISVGLAQGALEDSVAYAKERTAFKRPINQFQSIQNKLADMATQIEAGRLMLYHAAGRLDANLSVTREAPMTKLFTSEMATRAAMEAIQIHGGYGYLRDYNVERYMRDAKLCEIGEGTSEIMRILISRTL